MATGGIGGEPAAAALHRRWTLTGLVLVAVYVATAAATATWAPGRMRPLFDGFGSHPGQYHWVSPPEEFAAGNQPPGSAEIGLAVDDQGSQQISVAPDDGQVLVALTPGALAAHPPDTNATLEVTPVDAGGLGALPAGLRAEGNAYRVDIAYAPSGTKVTALARPGTLGLTSAAPADTLVFSPDGGTWVTRDGQPLAGGNGLTGPMEATGYYLAASRGPARPVEASSGGANLLLILGAVIVPIGLLLLRPRRRSPVSPAGRPGAGGRRR